MTSVAVAVETASHVTSFGVYELKPYLIPGSSRTFADPILREDESSVECLESGSDEVVEARRRGR